MLKQHENTQKRQKRTKNSLGSQVEGSARRRRYAPPPGPHFLVALPLSQVVFGLFLVKICLNHGYEVFLGERRGKIESYQRFWSSGAAAQPSSTVPSSRFIVVLGSPAMKISQTAKGKETKRTRRIFGLREPFWRFGTVVLAFLRWLCLLPATSLLLLRLLGVGQGQDFDGREV